MGDCAVDNSAIYVAVYLAQAYQAFLRLCIAVGVVRLFTLQQTRVSLFLYHRFLLYISSRSRGKRLMVRQYSGTYDAYNKLFELNIISEQNNFYFVHHKRYA